MSVGYRQTGPGQHQAVCSDDSNQTAASCSSLLPSDSVRSACPTTAGPSRGQLSGTQLVCIQAVTEPSSPLHFVLLSLCVLCPFIFLEPTVPLVPAALLLVTNHTNAKHVLSESRGPVPARLLSPGEGGYLAVLFKSVTGGKWKSGTTEDSRSAASEAVSEHKWVQCKALLCRQQLLA